MHLECKNEYKNDTKEPLVQKTNNDEFITEKTDTDESSNLINF